MTDFQRHEFSVLEVCEALKGSVTGSFGGLQQDQLQHRADWLTWRIFEAWEAPKPGLIFEYEEAVRDVAIFALAIWNQEHNP